MSGLRRRLRGSVERAFALSGLLAWREGLSRRGLAVLTYHRVLPRAECARTRFPGLAMPLDAFEEQLAWLARHARVLPVGEALAELEGGDGRARAPRVALSFDDGYADNAEHAAPALARHGLRASFFVTTGFVEGEPLWFERAAAAWERAEPAARARALAGTGLDARLAGGAQAPWIERLKRLASELREQAVLALERASGREPAGLPRAMTREMLRALASAGHEVGAHGRTHALLVGLEAGELERELDEPRERLAQWLGAPPAGLCYPNGDADTRVATAAQRAGYAYACTTRPGLNRAGCERFFLARTDLAPQHVHDLAGAHDLLAFRCELAGVHEVFR